MLRASLHSVSACEDEKIPAAANFSRRRVGRFVPRRAEGNFIPIPGFSMDTGIVEIDPVCRVHVSRKGERRCSPFSWPWREARPWIPVRASRALSNPCSTKWNIGGTWRGFGLIRGSDLEVRARSFRGFVIIGNGISQETADRTRMDVEKLLDLYGVTALDVQRLSERYCDLGMTSVDLRRLTPVELARYGIDPVHAKASKHLDGLLDAVRKLGALRPASYLAFRAEPLAA